ncbi:MAG TPA: Holliday junction branch migration protein RuvA [Gammaproteobacteria bacterium]|nr:Holliday junction branch migration protein RuvA [Gammaproteobacteria bacterium]
MIGSLTGTLAAKQPPWLMLDVGGVGYELEAPMSTFYELPQVGSRLTLVTHLVVREDAHLLYGFLSHAERVLFRELLKVSSIGPRIALAVLSSTSVKGFHQCIQRRDLASLVRIPGVGKKTAERLIVEMTDRLPDDWLDGSEISAPAAQAASEAESALLSLGYRPAEVTRMLGSFDTAGLSTEALIREALRQVHPA